MVIRGPLGLITILSSPALLFSCQAIPLVRGPHIVPTTSEESLYVVNAVAGEGRRRRRQAAAVHQLAAGSRYLC